MLAGDNPRPLAATANFRTPPTFVPAPSAYHSSAAALAGMAGLALGRASTSHGVQRLVVTALAVAAVPLAGRVLGSLLGGAAYSRLAPPPRHFADRQARRRQLRRAAQQAAEQAAAVGAISEEEQRLLAMVTVSGWVGSRGGGG